MRDALCEEPRRPFRSSTARSRQDDGRTKQTDCSARDIPTIRPDALNAPQPKQRGNDVNAAIRGVSPACGLRFDQRQQVREYDQGKDTWNQPPRRLTEAQPAPEGKATRDFSNGGPNIDSCRLHPDRFTPSAARFKALKPSPRYTLSTRAS